MMKVSFLILFLSLISFFIGRERAYFLKRRQLYLPSLPFYYGLSMSLMGIAANCLMMIFLRFGLSATFTPWVIYGALIVSSFIGASVGYYLIRPSFKAQSFIEKIIKLIFLLAVFLSILITLAIIASMVFESIRFFSMVPLKNFFFSTQWTPLATLGEHLKIPEGHFGMLPLLVGSIMVTVIALLITVPIGLGCAIYLSIYASPKTRQTLKPLLEILGGIPTVVYGFIAIILVAPLIRYIGNFFGIVIVYESALTVGFVMGIMMTPFFISYADDILSSLPKALNDGSLALGATQFETMRFVLIQAAIPGLLSTLLLSISRAMGETMLVVMAAGLTAHFTLNPLDPVTTVTVQIVNLLTGDQEFNSAKTLAAFALGLMLFIITLILNIIALKIVHRYQAKYE